MYLVPIVDEEYYEECQESVNFWSKNVYGVDFTPLRPLAKSLVFEEPQVEYISGENELAFPVMIAELDILTVTLDDLKHIRKDFRFSAIISGTD